ncbi:hypothetical protein, partial [Bacteroides sp. 519]|uniref:hypothetical protein n=1 Tax=Bacteroides sp. 519 TaxID=2302937 RepID=UPI0013D03494
SSFAVAGEDKVFHFARAYKEGDRIIVISDEVKKAYQYIKTTLTDSQTLTLKIKNWYDFTDLIRKLQYLTVKGNAKPEDTIIYYIDYPEVEKQGIITVSAKAENMNTSAIYKLVGL